METMDNEKFQFDNFDQFKQEFESVTEEDLFELIFLLPKLALEFKESNLIYDIIQELVSVAPSKDDKFSLNFLKSLRFINKNDMVDNFELCKIVINFLEDTLDKKNVDPVYHSALDAMLELFSKLSGEEAEELFVPVLKKMNLESKFDNGKCSLAYFIPICYKQITDKDNKNIVRDMVTDLLNCESPVVRKAIVTQLGDFINVAEDKYVKNLWASLLDHINNDGIDYIRILGVDVAVSIAKRLNETECKEVLMNFLICWQNDLNWKVRHRLATKISDMQAVLPYENILYEVFSIYEVLCKDQEPEVRVAAVRNLYDYCEEASKIFSNSEKFQCFFKTYIMPIIRTTIDDPKDFVKEALSKTAIRFTVLVNETCFISEILPSLLQLMRGNQSMEFWDNIFKTLVYLPNNKKNMTELFKEIGELMSKIIANSSFHWRTRRSILIGLIHLVKICDYHFFHDNLCAGYLYLWTDRVFAVRRIATIVLPVLAKYYGFDYIQKIILPFFITLKDDDNYSFRLLSLYAIIELIEPTLNSKNININNFLKQLEKIGSKTQLAATVVTLHTLSVLLREKTDRINFNRWRDCVFTKENISLYAETTLDQQSYECDIMAIEEKELINVNKTYVIGLLFVLQRDLIDVVENLLQDSIENVKEKAVYTLNIIENFLRKLEDGLEVYSIEHYVTTLEDEELTTIDNNIDEELKITLSSFNKDNKEKLFNKISSLIDTANSESSLVLIEENTQLEYIEERIKIEEIEDDAEI